MAVSEPDPAIVLPEADLTIPNAHQIPANALSAGAKTKVKARFEVGPFQLRRLMTRPRIERRRSCILAMSL
jgi:hypothetical protein